MANGFAAVFLLLEKIRKERAEHAARRTEPWAPQRIGPTTHTSGPTTLTSTHMPWGPHGDGSE